MKKAIFLVMCTLMMMPLSFASGEGSKGETQTPGGGASHCREGGGEGKVPGNSTNETAANAKATETTNVQDNE